MRQGNGIYPLIDQLEDKEVTAKKGSIHHQLPALIVCQWQGKGTLKGILSVAPVHSGIPQSNFGLGTFLTVKTTTTGQ